jgi:hypothetical protein
MIMFKRRFAGVAVLALHLAVVVSAHAANNYGKELTKEYRQAFDIKKDDGQYRWFGYAVDNFGVLTSYDPANSKSWKDSDRICATWTCIGVKQQDIPSDHTLRLNINNFADVGGGGAVTLDDTKKRSIVFSVILPQLASLLKLNGSVDWSKNVTTKMTFKNAYKRSINRDAFRKYLEKSDNKTLVDAFTAGRLSYIAADIVIEDVDVDMKIDGKLNASADATLTQAASIVSKDSSASLKIGTSGNGEYKIHIPGFVILAVQTRSQPGAGVLTTGSDIGRDLNVVVPHPDFSRK